MEYRVFGRTDFRSIMEVGDDILKGLLIRFLAFI